MQPKPQNAPCVLFITDDTARHQRVHDKLAEHCHLTVVTSFSEAVAAASEITFLAIVCDLSAGGESLLFQVESLIDASGARAVFGIFEDGAFDDQHLCQLRAAGVSDYFTGTPSYETLRHKLELHCPGTRCYTMSLGMIELIEQTLFISGRELTLSKMVAKHTKLLMDAGGTHVSQETLMTHTGWSHDAKSARTRSYIYTLRKQLHHEAGIADPENLIVWNQGAGYRLNVDY